MMSSDAFGVDKISSVEFEIHRGLERVRSCEQVPYGYVYRHVHRRVLCHMNMCVDVCRGVSRRALLVGAQTAVARPWVVQFVADSKTASRHLLEQSPPRSGVAIVRHEGG